MLPAGKLSIAHKASIGVNLTPPLFMYMLKPWSVFYEEDFRFSTLCLDNHSFTPDYQG